MKIKKQIIAVVLVLALLLTVNIAVFAVHSFNDVESKDWYNEAVDYVYNNGLMSGTSNESFGPNVNMSRAMLVTVLYRLAGSPDANTALPFADVTEDAYYYVPVMWCYGNGIVAGTSEKTFSPDANISREQMVTIFARYAEYKGLDISDTADLSGYGDVSSISAYAVDAFGWAVKAGIVSGTSETALSPQGPSTRAQCAVIMQRYIEWAEADAVEPTVTPSLVPTTVPVVTPTASPIVIPDVTPGIDSTPAPTVEPTPVVTPVPTPTPSGGDDWGGGEMPIE